MQLDDLLGHRQTKAVTLPHRLSREEWVEYLTLQRFGYADTGIFDVNDNRLTHGNRTTDSQRAAAWHCLDGIHDEVYEYLLHFLGVYSDYGHRGKLFRDGDMALLDLVLNQPERHINDRR